MIETQPLHDRTGGDGPAPSAGRARIPGRPPSRSAVEARRELLEQLQVMEIHLQTATMLETRAERTANPTFAVVLRERAGYHRRAAARVLESLVLRGHVARRPRRRPPMPPP